MRLFLFFWHIAVNAEDQIYPEHFYSTLTKRCSNLNNQDLEFPHVLGGCYQLLNPCQISLLSITSIQAKQQPHLSCFIVDGSSTINNWLSYLPPASWGRHFAFSTGLCTDASQVAERGEGNARKLCSGISTAVSRSPQSIVPLAHHKL